LAVATPEIAGDNSKIATALLSPSATNNRRPSGERANAFGVLPSPVAAGDGSLSVPTTCLLRVSTTLIWSVLPDATKRREPSEVVRSADGCRPTLIRVPESSIPFAVAAKAETVHPPHAETNTDPSGVTATPYGYRSVGSR
jgi:hypothetical protein